MSSKRSIVLSTPPFSHADPLEIIREAIHQSAAVGASSLEIDASGVHCLIKFREEAAVVGAAVQPWDEPTRGS